MSWAPLLHFNFENHAALDETGHGFHGNVELPGPDRWVNAPAEGIGTAVRFDHARSKIVVPASGKLAGWRGFRARAYFRADIATRRLNLVEGDSSFALFIEPNGVLHGTINDGSPQWWGVSSAPNCVQYQRWHCAELLYDTGQVLALSLDGRLLAVRTTGGLPIRPVGAAGISFGYWPGGDARYTFSGLLGPVWIDTLDEREPLVEIINKAVCAGSNGSSRLELLNAALEEELTEAEKNSFEHLGEVLASSVRRLAAVVIGQAADPAVTLDQLTAIADEIGRLATEHETAGSDAFNDPVFGAHINQLCAVACARNPAAASVFSLEALKILAARPLTGQRWNEILQRHPELCTSRVPSVDQHAVDSGGTVERSLDDLIKQYCGDHGPRAVESCSSCGDSRGPQRQALPVSVQRATSFRARRSRPTLSAHGRRRSRAGRRARCCRRGAAEHRAAVWSASSCRVRGRGLGSWASLGAGR
jgi:hypothetical protein